MTSKAIYEWVDERLGLSELAAFARHKTVPVHSQSFWYYWGGISLFLFLVQCFTGVLLLVYYRPGAEAYESVRQITFVMHFGWLIRSAHAWSASLMIFSILVHMFSVYFMKAYRKPREFGWLSGMALLGMASAFLPVTDETWQEVITQRFESKGARVTEKNLEAFHAGRGLVHDPVGA